MFGIYAIRNKVNGKVYIGSTTQTFDRRWSKHLSSLNNNKHQNRYLQRSWNKYGEESFEFKIIEILTNKNDAVPAEQFYIDVFFGDGCYNIRPVADSSRGIKRSKEYCEKLSERTKGKKWTQAQKDNQSRLSKERCNPGGKWALEHSARMKGKKQPSKSAIARAMKIKTWRGFISPEGIKYENIEDLVAFAREHNLNAQGLRQIGSGYRKTYKKWRAVI